ncbi:hypothetical protein C1940_17455 (plasmid) [Lactiplantibacillus plantarum subsp. plantarum]|uniref:hypothetical protein n=1 Tax=Lactiplantibacillus plantarum TaxID=1590 RepID=UPI000CD3419B|nr:hypothetical protein [Lactiplantibacillus plantarum]AUV74238.1 hypothetical protein C1940_17455 [Lactiplantibacillus plantarum subsp. plantarum]
MKIDKELSQDDRSYLTYLTMNLLTSLDSLVHPYQATVQIDELSPFLDMIWLDDFDLLFNYFDFDWLKSDRDAIKRIAEQHVELKRSNGYSVPQTTESEKTIFNQVIKDLNGLNKSLIH